ncbi:MAG: DUF4381 domain-containing protein [Gammaproteobacteria bacterium]
MASVNPTPPMGDPLSQLRDIHVPASIEWWPPAPGWWFLATAVTAFALWAAFVAVRRYRAAAPLRQAERDLAGCFQRFTKERANGELTAKRALANDVNAVLKRVALVRYPRAEVADLTGTSWTHFLDRTGRTDQFTSGMGRVLGDDRFAPTFSFDAAGLRLAVDHWLGEQRRSKPATASTRAGSGGAGSMESGSVKAGSVGAALAANQLPRESDHSLLRRPRLRRPRLRPLPQAEPTAPRDRASMQGVEERNQ